MYTLISNKTPYNTETMKNTLLGHYLHMAESALDIQETSKTP